jgi:serine/threonine-protein kinase
MDDDALSRQDDETSSAEDRAMRRKVFIGLAVLAAVPLLLAGARLLASPLLQVRVPDVVGMTYGQTIAALERTHLTPHWRKVREGDEGTARVGKVVRQYPPPGTPIERRSSVDAEIVVGPRRLRMPDVTKLGATEAVDKLRVLGLWTGWESETLQGFAVESQQPPAGRRVEAGTDVRIVLGTHPGASSDAAWTRREHQTAVEGDGVGPCFQCHGETFCTDCHVKAPTSARTATPPAGAPGRP